MVVMATKPKDSNPPSTSVEASGSEKRGTPQPTPPAPPTATQEALDKSARIAALTPEEKSERFGRKYFDLNGGAVPGGMFYLDVPHNEVVARHVLARRPTSVLELGCSRGYILKRIEDAGVPIHGLDVSKHCYLTRATEGVTTWDICKTPWPVDGKEMFRTTQRGLHAVSYKPTDDPTQITTHDKAWWTQVLPPGHEVMSLDELRGGPLPSDYLKGDGRSKWNIGSAWTMYHHGWKNVDVVDAAQFAQANGYEFLRHDVRNGIPCKTGEADLIFMSHVLEHFTYGEGLSLLRECRRALKVGGAIRVLVPDARNLMKAYAHDHPFDSCQDHIGTSLTEFDQVNADCEKAVTSSAKLYSLMCGNHLALYDEETLELTSWRTTSSFTGAMRATATRNAGFIPYRSAFRRVEKIADVPHPGFAQISREAGDNLPCLTLYMNGIAE